jgi:prophage regulatory protein
MSLFFGARRCGRSKKLVSKQELKTVYGRPYCPAHIARLEKAGQFPTRVRLGATRRAADDSATLRRNFWGAWDATTGHLFKRN